MLSNIRFAIILLVFCFVVINAGNYYKKTTPKPPTPTTKPTPPKPTTTKPKPTTTKPKPTTTKPKPTTTKPYYPSYGGGSSGGGSGGGGSSGGGSGGGSSGGGSPMPYKFEYSANVGSPDPTGMISQSESGDANGVVTGMYSLRDPDGRERTVIYRADSDGFRATVETNELPPDVPNPADVTIIGSGPLPSTGGGSSGGGGSGGGETTEGGYEEGEGYY